MPKMLWRQKAGNKLECLYPSVCWSGRNDFMLHSLPRASITASSIMEKCVPFVFQWMIKCSYSGLIFISTVVSHSMGKMEWGSWPCWGRGSSLATGRTAHLPTCEYIIQWLDECCPWKLQAVHFILRELDSDGLWFSWTDVDWKQGLRWRNPWLYLNMNIWF